mgnify:CR=1 FL=1
MELLATQNSRISHIETVPYKIEWIWFNENFLGAPVISSSLQNSLDNVSEWSVKWQLNISVGKCNVLHIGGNNPEFKYFLDGKALTPSNCVKDLGVFTSNTMSSTFHCNELYKKASRICALIRKTFISLVM